MVGASMGANSFYKKGSSKLPDDNVQGTAHEAPQVASMLVGGLLFTFLSNG